MRKIKLICTKVEVLYPRLDRVVRAPEFMICRVEGGYEVSRTWGHSGDVVVEFIPDGNIAAVQYISVPDSVQPKTEPPRRKK